MKDTTNRVVPKPKLGFEICPMCGFFSKVTPRDGKKPYWVCKGCDDDYQTYIKEVEMKIKTGEIPKIIWTKSEWLLIHLDPSSIEKELIEAREKRDHLKERVAQKIRTETGGKDIDKRLVSALAERYEKEMSTDDYNLIRWLYGWLKATLQLKAELENKIAAEKAA